MHEDGLPLRAFVMRAAVSIRRAHTRLARVCAGSTMLKLVPYLQSFGAASVKVATLLTKRTPKSKGFVADYTGF
eukprot:2257574-Prymnesium_polylepis.1